MTPSDAIARVEWDEARSLLSFVVGRALVSTVVAFTIPASAGLSLPLEGVLLGDVTISTESPTGVVHPTDFDFDAIGSFTTETNVSFANMVAGNQSDLAFSFSATMAIRRTEFIALDLPGFTAIEKEVEVFSTPEGFFRTVTRHPTS